jgi:hypothetical protein
MNPEKTAWANDAIPFNNGCIGWLTIQSSGEITAIIEILS